jgi:hypothetical protein
MRGRDASGRTVRQKSNGRCDVHTFIFACRSFLCVGPPPLRIGSEGLDDVGMSRNLPFPKRDMVTNT